ncbi:MAG: L,D-transpeptidase family protein [Desulfobulbaceae bacterium]|nr:L,D-transpeptidase family protein [Desulfobulbaceae bacterium]
MDGRGLSEQIGELIAIRLQSASPIEICLVGKEAVCNSNLLTLFYRDRGYLPAWSTDHGVLPIAGELYEAIRKADLEGLRPEDYHAEKLKDIFSRLSEEQASNRVAVTQLFADLDLLCTDAFLTYASHLSGGKINPETVDPEWGHQRSDIDPVNILRQALATGHVSLALNNVAPTQAGYFLLKKELVRYRDIGARGGWPQIVGGGNLKKGVRDSRVIALRRRLSISGELATEAEIDIDLVDDNVSEAISNFQQRHGLEVDGIVGPATLAVLNVSIQQRINQIETNLERYRWLPRSHDRRHLIVNIADYMLEVVEDDEVVMEMRVIVGMNYRRTPQFNGKMTYLVFCPYWYIPYKVAVEDKLPLIRVNPGYLVEHNMQVFDGVGNDAEEVDPSLIDWSQLNGKNFTYNIRQAPGPANALGRVKFMFPNKYNVYLHDTSSRELFNRRVRTFSSGCIRVEKPLQLAEYVLRNDPKWSRENILAAVNAWKEQTVTLPEAIAVSLIYRTAWVDKNNVLQFRNDVYGRDELLGERLREGYRLPEQK